MGRKVSIAKDHWTLFNKSDKGPSYDTVECNYCQHKMVWKAGKCALHTSKCGHAPDEVREKILAEPRETHRKRTHRNVDDSSSDDELSNTILKAVSDGAGAESGGDVAMSLLNNLFGLGASRKAREKPLNQYTDEQLSREERELTVREKRLKIKHLELKNDLCERAGPVLELFERFLLQGGALMENMAEKQNQEKEGAAGVFPDGTLGNSDVE